MAVPPVCLGRAQCDLSNPQAVADRLFEIKPDAIINAAAFTAVEAAETQVDQATALNTHAPQALADVASRLNVPFLHISTDYVFDGRKSVPYSEMDTPNPLNVYGRTKLDGERAVLATYPDALIIRSSWVFSPYGHNFVRTMLQRAMKGEALSVVDDQIGTPTSALDLASACLEAIQAKLDGAQAQGVFHYAARGETSWFHFAQTIFEQTADWRGGKRVEVRAIGSDEFKTQAVRPKNSRLNSDAFVRTFNYRQPTWQDSLATTLARLEPEFRPAGSAP
jgi:dTDP-4-dehydrorhamnose reductase